MMRFCNVLLYILSLDLNECSSVDDNSCEHECINTYGSYECACDHGYSLTDDQITCIGIVCYDIYNIYLIYIRIYLVNLVAGVRVA